MEKDAFISLLKTGQANAPGAKEQISALIREHPYCQTGRSLLAKILHDEKDQAYSGALKLAAIYSVDRQSLYYFLLKPLLQKVVNEFEGVQKESAPFEPGDLSDKPALTPQREQEKLEKEILRQAISSSIIEEIAAKPIISETKEAGTAMPEKQAGKPPETSHAETREKLTFTQWLQNIDNAKITVDKEASRASSKPGTSFFSPVNMARLSLIEDEEFITETLAKIYARQKHYEKAIRAYEKLGLKNPKKNAYFAARIKELEDIIKKEK
ncbi:MAG: hypothetical protein ACE5DN_03395 [Flavobacteriales bacterium]